MRQVIPSQPTVFESFSNQAWAEWHNKPWYQKIFRDAILHVCIRRNQLYEEFIYNHKPSNISKFKDSHLGIVRST